MVFLWFFHGWQWGPHQCPRWDTSSSRVSHPPLEIGFQSCGGRYMELHPGEPVVENHHPPVNDGKRFGWLMAWCLILPSSSSIVVETNWMVSVNSHKRKSDLDTSTSSTQTKMMILMVDGLMIHWGSIFKNSGLSYLQTDHDDQGPSINYPKVWLHWSPCPILKSTNSSAQ